MLPTNGTNLKPASQKRGRDIFFRFQPVLLSLAKLFNVFPRSLRQWLWSVSNICPDLVGIGLRYSLLKSSAKSCGANVRVGPFVSILNQQNLSIGNNVSIHQSCYLDAAGGISIGDDVSIAHHSSILSTNHAWSDDMLPIRDQPVTFAPVVLNNDIWIGCGVRILGNVTIGTRCIVAAGSVVTKSIPNGTMSAGIPATPRKKL